MADELEMNMTLGDHRGKAQDLFKEAFEDEEKAKTFFALFDKRTDKDELLEKYSEFDEDFTAFWLKDRDII